MHTIRVALPLFPFPPREDGLHGRRCPQVLTPPPLLVREEVGPYQACHRWGDADRMSHSHLEPPPPAAVVGMVTGASLEPLLYSFHPLSLKGEGW